MSSSTFNITPSLVDDPRHNLEAWTENVETHARNMCASHDLMGALTLVVSDVTWELVPANLTNPVDVAAGQPAVYRARPNWDMPAAHAGNAASGAVNLHRMLMEKYNDFSLASSALNTALLVSIGDVNQNILRTTFPALKPYMLTPIQIVTTMLTQHGVATGDDVTKLQDPLSQAMTSLSDLTKHMANFLLASQRLTRSGQGETPYKYFKLFLETVSSFPSIGQSLTTYYAQYPAITQQSVVTLFPFLEQMKDHLLRNAPSSPFSGLAQQPGLTRKQRRDRANQTKNKGKDGGGNKTTQRTPRWSPHGSTLLAATAATPTDYTPYLAEIQRLQGALAAHTGSYQLGADFGMPVALQAAPMPSVRPREFYCWLHGWNNTHHGTTCKIMGANTAYTQTMKNATGAENTGGNPKVGVPVHLHRISDKPPFSLMSCAPCLPSPTLVCAKSTFNYPPVPFLPPPFPTTSPASSSAKPCVGPYEATRTRPAILATLVFKQAEGPRTHQPYEDTKASSARKISASLMLSKSEGNNSRVRDVSEF